MATGLDLKARWRQDEVSLGLFIHTTDPSIVNVLTDVGLDWLIIDTEHQPFNPETLQALLLTIRGTDTVPLVRVADNDAALIKQALDFGAEGILVPLIRSADEARQAVAACKYPPMGIRGMGGRAVTDFYREAVEYAATANERTIVVLQIEHVEAVECIDEIARVPGVDCLFMGQLDLSATMGIPWQIDHPRVIEATQRVIAAARAANVSAGLGVDASPEAVLDWVVQGARCICIGIDWLVIRRAAEEAVRAIRGRL